MGHVDGQHAAAQEDDRDQDDHQQKVSPLDEPKGRKKKEQPHRHPVDHDQRAVGTDRSDWSYGQIDHQKLGPELVPAESPWIPSLPWP